MNPQDHDHSDEGDFNAFLRGKGELAQMLRQMPQPTPSAALDEAILAAAQTALHQNPPANDAFVSNSTQGALPSQFRRARWPYALAATVLLAVVAGVQWQSQTSDQGMIVAQAPAPSVAQPAAAPPALPEPIVASTDYTGKRKPESVHGEVNHSLPETVQTQVTVIAQADVAQDYPDSKAILSPASPSRAQRAAPAPAPAAVAPVVPAAPSAMAPPPVLEGPARPDAASIAPDVEKAKVWLKLIDELIKADLQRDALEEWQKFRKDYPHYAVPQELAARINALKR